MQNKSSFILAKINFLFLVIVLTSCLPANITKPSTLPPTSGTISTLQVSSPTFTPVAVLMTSKISGWAVYSSIVSYEPFVTQIFLKNLDTGDVTQLTNSGNNGLPRWSPDGSKIMFLSWTKENSDDIYLMNKDGSDQRPIVTSPAHELMVDWSPDGRKIVFVSDKDGSDEIYVIDLNTQTTVRLTNNSINDTSPKWSSDGKYIAFISNTGASGRSQVFIMNADGTDSRQITSYNLDFFEDSPLWCPDDSCIIFTRFLEGVPKLMLLDLKKKVATPLFNVFDPKLPETRPALSLSRGYLTFSDGDVFYAMDLKNREIYPLDIHALDLSLYP